MRLFYQLQRLEREYEKREKVRNQLRVEVAQLTDAMSVQNTLRHEQGFAPICASQMIDMRSSGGAL